MPEPASEPVDTRTVTLIGLGSRWLRARHHTLRAKRLTRVISCSSLDIHITCTVSGRVAPNTCVSHTPVNWYNNDSHTQLEKISSLPAYKYVRYMSWHSESISTSRQSQWNRITQQDLHIVHIMQRPFDTRSTV